MSYLSYNECDKKLKESPNKIKNLYTQNELLKKRKKLKLAYTNINRNRLIINGKIIHSAKKLKKKKLEIKKELLYNNIFDFKPETERNEKIIKLEEGFIRKIDYDIKNLINKKNKNKRAKTANINNNRIDQSINDMENYINKFIELQEYNLNYNYKNKFDINNYKSINNIITDINEEQINNKKKDRKKENIINIKDIDRKVLFIDNKNNLISKNNILNLLKEEELLIDQKLKNDYRIKNFSKYIQTKEGKKILLPILYRNIINRNEDNKNIIYKDSKSPFMTSIEKKKEKNHINNLFYTIELKHKLSKPNSSEEKYYQTTTKNNSINNNKNNNLIYIYNNYLNKNSLNLNQETFNKLIVINKKENKNNLQKRNSMPFKNIYLNFTSKYPYNDIIDISINDNNNKPNTERKKENNLQSPFKNKFKKGFNKRIKSYINETNKNKIANTEQNIKENKEINKKLIIKKIAKSENKKGKKEKKKKNKKNKEMEKNEENKSIISYKNKSFKLKNKDLLKIKKYYKNYTNTKNYNNNNNIEESTTENPKNNTNNINNININMNLLYNKYLFNKDKITNINDISKENSKEEENSNDNKKPVNPKIGLLINHIKKILYVEKKKEEIRQRKAKEAELKKSYEFFKQQIEKVDKMKTSKTKTPLSELNNSNKEENKLRKTIFRSITKNYNKLNILEQIKSKEINDINEEDENKNKNNEKNKLLIEEMKLINEIKFYMSTMDDPENQKKFENLLKQIEKYRKLNEKDYIKLIKESFGNFKYEIEDLFRAKEIEDRINGFVTNLDKEINKVEVKRDFYESLINIIDYKFKSNFEKADV